MKRYAIVIAAVSLFCLNLSAASLMDRGKIFEDPHPQHFKVVGMSFDVEQNKAIVAMKKHCPVPHSGGYVPGQGASDPETGIPGHGCGKTVKVALDLADAADKTMYDMFLTTNKGCNCCNGGTIFIPGPTPTDEKRCGCQCHCRCVELLIKDGNILKMGLKENCCEGGLPSPGPCPGPGPYDPNATVENS